MGKDTASLKVPLPVSFRWNSAVDFQEKVSSQKYQGRNVFDENRIQYKEQGFVDAWELDVDAKSLQRIMIRKRLFAGL